MPSVIIHTLLEIFAYTAGFQLFLWQQRQQPLAVLTNLDVRLWIIAGTILGAALGAKLSFWLEDPLFAFTNFPSLQNLLGGKSIVGGLLGGLTGVEITKRLLGVSQSTGDSFVWPLIVGMSIGRVGCFLSGLADHTYGNPTDLPWAYDFGDGIPRHPTQLYEIFFLVLLGFGINKAHFRFHQTGDRFRLFMIGYLLFRLLIEFIKPMPFVYFEFLSGIQLLCIAGLIYYHRHLLRIMRELLWSPK